jgi:transcriptional regulator with XRE-family HTH domain
MDIITGKDLQLARANAGITQKQLAEYLGYMSNGQPNASMIARFENDHAKINSRVRIAIQHFFREQQQPVS